MSAHDKKDALYLSDLHPDATVAHAPNDVSLTVSRADLDLDFEDDEGEEYDPPAPSKPAVHPRTPHTLHPSDQDDEELAAAAAAPVDHVAAGSSTRIESRTAEESHASSANDASASVGTHSSSDSPASSADESENPDAPYPQADDTQPLYSTEIPSGFEAIDEGMVGREIDMDLQDPSSSADLSNLSEAYDSEAMTLSNRDVSSQEEDEAADALGDDVLAALQFDFNETPIDETGDVARSEGEADSSYEEDSSLADRSFEGGFTQPAPQTTLAPREDAAEADRSMESDYAQREESDLQHDQTDYNFSWQDQDPDEEEISFQDLSPAEDASEYRALEGEPGDLDAYPAGQGDDGDARTPQEGAPPASQDARSARSPSSDSDAFVKGFFNTLGEVLQDEQASRRPPEHSTDGLTLDELPENDILASIAPPSDLSSLPDKDISPPVEDEAAPALAEAPDIQGTFEPAEADEDELDDLIQAMGVSEDVYDSAAPRESLDDFDAPPSEERHWLSEGDVTSVLPSVGSYADGLDMDTYDQQLQPSDLPDSLPLSAEDAAFLGEADMDDEDDDEASARWRSEADLSNLLSPDPADSAMPAHLDDSLDHDSSLPEDSLYASADGRNDVPFREPLFTEQQEPNDFYEETEGNDVLPQENIPEGGFFGSIVNRVKNLFAGSSSPEEPAPVEEDSFDVNEFQVGFDTTEDIPADDGALTVAADEIVDSDPSLSRPDDEPLPDYDVDEQVVIPPEMQPEEESSYTDDTQVEIDPASILPDMAEADPFDKMPEEVLPEDFDVDNAFPEAMDESAAFEQRVSLFDEFDEDDGSLDEKYEDLNALTNGSAPNASQPDIEAEPSLSWVEKLDILKTFLNIIFGGAYQKCKETLNLGTYWWIYVDMIAMLILAISLAVILARFLFYA